ncbi:TIGR01841 family phasin [Paraburkholderia hospita]|uniref:Phasin n=1 Tax=Paraburkholderia hospita TaxID=169430 RepID=A0AAN1JMG4_9BURK|nr:TIGR01841 family phasin [Paraburkholderia hospita]AUT76546.1 phasin [Paraburkholderia hospita]SEI22085.1 phasin family protein [Paraburkholderia hospita]
MADFQGQAAMAQQANLDFFFGLAGSMLEGEEKLIRLNLDTAKTAFADWNRHMQDGMAKKDRQEAGDMRDTLLLPSAEKVLAYERQVAEIASTTQAQLSEVVNARYQEVSRQVQSFAENLAQNAPVGSEAAMAFLKQAITLANAAQESVQIATKQAVEDAQTNPDAATKAASEVTEAADQAVENATKSKAGK